METPDEIVDAAAGVGVALSRSQLGRLHRAGLIPRPLTKRLGKGKGTRSFYPSGTLDRVLRLMQLGRSTPSLAQLAWTAWWEDGGTLTPAARAFLTEVATDYEKTRRWLDRLMRDEERGDPAAAREMDVIYEEAQRSRLTGVMAVARRRVGRAAFSSVVRVLAEVAVGRFDGHCYAAAEGLAGRSTAELVERALGIDRARVDVLADVGPWYSGDSGADLARLSRALSAQPLTKLASSPDDLLDGARDEVRRFLTTTLTTAALTEKIFGRTAFGFGLIGRALRAQRPKQQAVLLLGWLGLREDEELRAGMLHLASLAPAAEATAQLHVVIEDLRVEVPAFAPLLTNQRIAAALRSAEQRERLDGELARAREDNKGAVAAFFEGHPDVNRLIEQASC